jgi:osmotically-inducible protein OsmY
MARFVGLLLAVVALASCSTSGRDAAITGKVRTVLQADRVVDASKIRVTTEKGVVTLAGTVAGEDAHQKAVELVGRIEGVRAVRDRLDVVPAPPAPAEAAPPAAPAGGAGSAALGGVLAEDRIRREPADQPGGNYGLLAAVVGSQGDVSLEPSRGDAMVEPAAFREVSAAPERPAPAVDIAGSRGEEAIATSLPLSRAMLGPGDDEDAAITARVREALVELGGRVQVLTRAGVVILSGAVDTERDRSEAIRIARATKGVARVEDRLIVLES